MLWLLSYGQNCIGVSVLAYALFVFAITCHSILMYDGAVHKGLDPKVYEINIQQDETREDAKNAKKREKKRRSERRERSEKAKEAKEAQEVKEERRKKRRSKKKKKKTKETRNEKGEKRLPFPPFSIHQVLILFNNKVGTQDPPSHLHHRQDRLRPQQSLHHCLSHLWGREGRNQKWWQIGCCLCW